MLVFKIGLGFMTLSMLLGGLYSLFIGEYLVTVILFSGFGITWSCLVSEEWV